MFNTEDTPQFLELNGELDLATTASNAHSELQAMLAETLTRSPNRAGLSATQLLSKRAR